MKSSRKPSLPKSKPTKQPPKSTKKRPKQKPSLADAQESYLNQNIIINTKDPSKIPLVHRRIASAMNVRTGSTLSKYHKRAESVFGMIRQSLHDKKLDTVDLDKLVTEEDVGMNDDEYYYPEEKESQCTGITTMRVRGGRFTREQAAVLIQKMWRGYQTRRLVNRYILLLNQKKISMQQRQPQAPQSNFNETKKYKKRGRKLSDLVDLQKTQKIPSWSLKAEIQENHTFKSEASPEIASSPEKMDWSERLQKLRNQRIPNWEEMVGIIAEVPSLDTSSKGMLIDLIGKIRDSTTSNSVIYINESESYSAAEVDKPEEAQMIINSKPSRLHQQSKESESIFVLNPDVNEEEDEEESNQRLSEQEHPWLKVLEMRLKIIKAREKAELKLIDGKLGQGELTASAYELKKQRIVGRYLRERREVLDHMEQISVGVERLNDSLIKTKIDATYLYQVCGKDYSIRHSLSSDTLIEQFIKCRDLFHLEDESFEMIHTESSIDELEIILPKYENRTSTELQSPSKSEQNRRRASNFEDAQLNEIKSSAEKIQQLLEQILIQDLCKQIYLNDTFYKAYQPLIDMHHCYSFSKVTDRDIDYFLDIIQERFMPSNDVLLTRLNQKINPTPAELLKILRNEEVMSSENEFYELVVPESSFKLFREWKEVQPPDNPMKMVSVVAVEWPFQLAPHQFEDRKWVERTASLQDKKRKLIKFQKDLQAMYFKSVFNCFNECIIDVKSSLSPLNGRSTIGPGELRVSMQDSNIKVVLQQVPAIVSRAKDRVLDNLEYKCPVLDQSNYLSLYRFQDQLNKQLHHDFELNEYKWVSFFDEFLELAVELSRSIEDHIFQEFLNECPMNSLF